jgi:hypothetical protein
VQVSVFEGWLGLECFEKFVVGECVWMLKWVYGGMVVGPFTRKFDRYETGKWTADKP